MSSPQFIGSLPVLQSQLRIYAERRAAAWRRPETAEGGLVGALSGELYRGGDCGWTGGICPERSVAPRSGQGRRTGRIFLRSS